MTPVTEGQRLPLIEIVVRDPLDGAAVQRVGAVLDDAIALRPRHLVVDLSGCQLLDAAGVGLLVDVHRRIREAGGRMTLSGVSPRLHRILHLTRVDRVLQTVGVPAGGARRTEPASVG